MNKLLILFSALIMHVEIVSAYFELRNHDLAPVDAFVIQPAHYIAQDTQGALYKEGRADFMRLPAKKGITLSRFSFPVFISYPTYLVISYQDARGNRQEDMYTFTLQKTIYVAFENGKIRPQKGSFGKTASGKPLKNNVSAKGIIKLTGSEQELINQMLRESKEFQELIKRGKLKSIPPKTPGKTWQKA